MYRPYLKKKKLDLFEKTHYVCFADNILLEIYRKNTKLEQTATDLVGLTRLHKNSTILRLKISLRTGRKAKRARLFLAQYIILQMCDKSLRFATQGICMTTGNMTRPIKKLKPLLVLLCPWLFLSSHNVPSFLL